jgi:hypothetical protein
MDRTIILKDRLLVTLTVQEHEKILEQAVEKAFAKQRPQQLMFTLPEAAEKLGIKPYRLGNLCRQNLVPHRRMPGSRMYCFSVEDLQKITAGDLPKEEGGE